MLWRRLDRYVSKEVLGPLALGVSTFTFILLLDTFFEVAKTVIHRGVSLRVVLELLALNLPHILVITIPMAFLFALLITVGRLSADSELVAIRASGVSLFSLYRPLLALSLVLGSLTGWVMISLVPAANSRAIELTTELHTANLQGELQPRVFHEQIEDRILYFFSTTPEGRWEGVFLADAILKTEGDVFTARYGELRTDEQGDLVLVLEDALTQRVNLTEPDNIQRDTQKTATRRLLDEDALRATSVSRSMRAMTISELEDIVDDPDALPARRSRAEVEIQKKFSIPAACLVFGLFGLPLGFSNKRGGRSSGFVLSIGVILAYYVLLSNGEEAATRGQMEPWVAMWGPNILFSLAGAFLLWRKNKDKSLLLGNADRFIRDHVWSRLILLNQLRRRRKLDKQQKRSAERDKTPDIVLRIPRLRIRFPNLFDRYIVKMFSKVFVMVVLAILAVYTIADFTQLVDDVMENEISSSVVLDYYKYYSLQIFYQMAPIIVLLTTLTTFAILSYSNEITAAKAAGMSLYRLAVPALVVALGIATLSVALESYVLPYTNTRAAEIQDTIKGRAVASRNYRRADRHWLFGDGNVIYNYAYFDARRGLLQRLQIFRFDEEHRLESRLFASQAFYNEGEWWIRDGWARSYYGKSLPGTDKSFIYLDGPLRIDLPEQPGFFDSEIKSPDRMPYGEYRDYVQRLKAAGEHVPEMEVELQNKIAMPIVCLVMALVALPFAFRLGRRGALYGIGLSLVLGITFFAIIAFFTTLGEAGALPPAVAVWSPNLLFATMSMYLFLGVRT